MAQNRTLKDESKYDFRKKKKKAKQGFQAVVVNASQQKQHTKHVSTKRQTVLELADTGCRETMYKNVLHNMIS